MSKETKPKELTREEILEKIKNREKFMDEQLPALRKESEFSRLKREIAENVYNEQLAKVRYGQLMAPPETKSNES